MEVRFVITPQVLYRAQRAMASQIRWLRWAAVWMSVLFPLFMIGLTLVHGGTIQGALASNRGMIVGLPLFWLFGIPLLQRWSAGRLLRNTPSLQGEQVYRFDASGIQESTPVSATTIRWDAIVRAAETPAFVLLFQSKAMALFVPKSAFAGKQELARFRQVVSTALGARAGWQPAPGHASAGAAA